MSNLKNIILNTDSYKASHYKQYPPGTTQVSSYIEARGGQYENSVFFGLQMFIKDYLMTPITQENIDEAEGIFELHGVPFNKEGWEYILKFHNGLLPIRIEAVKEGTILPVKNVLVQVTNTDKKCAWLTSYIETALLRAIWYPTTVATLSWHCRQVIERFLLETSDSTESIGFKLHDFGARGATSEEASEIGGLAHLTSFIGTDNLSAIVAARRNYHDHMAGFSIPAAEHSTITSWGKENEVAAYENMLDQFSGAGKIVAVVSDSYDLWNAIDNLWGQELKSKVQNSGGALVIRPDSGDPIDIVTKTIEKLFNVFGSEVNSKGYRVLPDYVRVIQGDGVSLQTIEAILDAMKLRKQSAENIAFGMGGELLQKINRDTMKFAMKASSVTVGPVTRDVFKDPITDSGKRSKKGKLALIVGPNGYETVRASELGGNENELELVFKNGHLLREQSLFDIRGTIASGIKSSSVNEVA